MQRMPKVAMDMWKRYLVGLKNKDFFYDLRKF